MPGLIDAHVHIWATDLDMLKLITRRTEYLAAFAYRSLAAMLDRGFTTVRDAGGTDVGYAQALADGLAVGPRLLHAGRILSQTGGHGDLRRPGDFICACELREGGGARFSHIVDSPDEVRKAVREELRNGAHQIKIMGSGGVASPADPVDRLQFSDAEISAAVEEADAPRRLRDGPLPSGRGGAALRRARRALDRARHPDRPGSGRDGGGQGRLRGADAGDHLGAAGGRREARPAAGQPGEAAAGLRRRAAGPAGDAAHRPEDRLRHRPAGRAAGPPGQRVRAAGPGVLGPGDPAAGDQRSTPSCCGWRTASAAWRPASSPT